MIYNLCQDLTADLSHSSAHISEDTISHGMPQLDITNQDDHDGPISLT